MREYEANLISAGYAVHGRIVSVDDERGYFVATACFPGKLTLNGTDSYYVLGKLNAFDYVDMENGIVSDGQGYYQFIDEDDDRLLARWHVDAVKGEGLMTFTGGTGKWCDAAGELVLALLVVPHENQVHESYVAGKGAGRILLPA